MSRPPFKVKAVYEYTSPHDDDLHFPNGQIITVTEEEDDDWYSGEYVDASGLKQEGIFPKNFVEKYEPTAPRRPIRTARPKREAEPAPEPEPVREPAHEPAPEPAPEQEQVQEAPVARAPPPPLSIPKPQAAAAALPPPKPVEASPPPAAKPVASSSKPVPPPVSEKPSGGSFRDRIAAFNKAAPPPAPFKPGGLSSGGSNTFIRKPFVAPPPSKNAYVPVSREPPPQRIYRREEDPEITAKEAETQEHTERAGLASTATGGEDEDQPKPTSLKERIALLQKQQLEQANRHAEAAQKKEKPKRPVKKRADSQDGDEAPLERKDTMETAGRASMDSVKEDRGIADRRKSMRGAPSTPGLPTRRSFGDGNEADMSGAGETTEEPEDLSAEKDDSDGKPKSSPPAAPVRAPNAPTHEPEVGEEEGATEEEEHHGEEADEEEEDEEEMDPEVRKKEELRARMAKMSGGMGMHGMFGAPMPVPGPMAPRGKKPTLPIGKRSGEYSREEHTSPVSSAPPIPMIPLPGMTQVLSPEDVKEEEEPKTPVSATRPAGHVEDVELSPPPKERAPPPAVPSHDAGAPPVPGGRPAPPPVPRDTRPNVPNPMSPSPGSESDDESSVRAPSEEPPPSEAPRPPARLAEGPESPKSPVAKRASYFGSDQALPASPTTPGLNNNNKRNSRLPPPIPGIAPLAQSRAPPPPPPGGPISRANTGQSQISPMRPAAEPSDEEVTEYEGDYDTDIASAAPPKDPLDRNARETSLDETSLRSPVTSPHAAPPPFPPTVAPRAVPPPPPSQPPPPARQSADMPRAAPPPPPPPPAAKVSPPWEQEEDNNEYDPYNYSGPKAVPAVGSSVGSPTPRIERTEEDLYSASPPRAFAPLSLQGRPPPQAPPRDDMHPSNSRGPPRQSMDISRSNTSARRSVELGRMSMDSGYVANDVDLAPRSFWWTQPKGLPPAFQGRRDVLFEFEESVGADRGGKTMVTKDLFILFQDYSQTVITAIFNPQDPADNRLEQRHEQPPARQRQDQLEQAHEQYGRRIFETCVAKKETVVGDGTPHGLVQELLKPLSGVLMPIGTRAYGAVVYSNLANASTQQNDEIRPGDIITLRNTKFQGKHGPMHAKYSMEVGKPDHVGVVAEWDGTKKKVRAWEQGRESKKNKMESFKLDDLRSGEVKIWRVMPRSWVGWQSQQ